MRKMLICLVVAMLIGYVSYGQRVIDSLKNVIATAPKDTNYAKALLRLSQLYNNKNQDSSIYFGNQIFTLPPSAQKPAIHVQAHMFIAYSHYMKGDYKSSIKSFKNMHDAAARAGDKNHMGIAIGNEGNVYIETGDYNTAIAKYREAKVIHESIKDDFGVARCFNNIGFVFKEIGEYDKAIDNFLYALKYFEKVKAMNETAMIHNNVASIYVRQKNFEKALEYNKTALAIQTKTNNNGGKAISQNAIGNIYAENKDYQKALAHYREAFGIYQAQKDKRQIAVMYNNLGKMYSLAEQYDSSIYYFEKGKELNMQMGNNRNLSSSLLGLASSLIATNQLEAASKNLDTAETIIRSTNKKDDLKNYYEVRSEYFHAGGNDKMSLDFYKKYTEVKDALFSEESTKTIADLNIKYESEKKKLQIDLLNKENTIKDTEIKLQRLALTKRAYELAKQDLALANASLTISNNELEIKSQRELLLQSRIDSAEAAQKLQNLNKQAQIQQLELEKEKLANSKKNIIISVILVITALLCLLGYSYYRRYKMKQAARLQEYVLQQQEQAANAVLAAEENERKRIAGDLHDGLGQLMSAAKMNLSVIESELNFDSAEQKFAFEKVLNLVDESLKEVRSVSHSMMPNALLKAGLASAISEFIKQIDRRVLKIQLHTEGLNERIDQNTESIVYRVVQECVTNVIKHAGATQLDISLIRSDDRIEATIEDNGKGFDTSSVSSGIGLKNIQSRIKFLKGEIEWSSYPSRGTLVAFHVPLVKTLQPV